MLIVSRGKVPFKVITDLMIPPSVKRAGSGWNSERCALDA